MPSTECSECYWQFGDHSPDCSRSSSLTTPGYIYTPKEWFPGFSCDHCGITPAVTLFTDANLRACSRCVDIIVDSMITPASEEILA